VNVNRREFMEKSAKTAAMVVIASAIPVSITRGAEGSSRSGTHALKQAKGNTMKDQQSSNYYVSQKSKLLEDFDKQALKYSRKVLVPHFGEDRTDAILRDVRREYETIIPKLPYIGGENNINTTFLIMSAGCLAIYKVLKDHDMTAEQIGKTIFEMVEARAYAYPKFFLRLVGKLKYGKKYEQYLKEQAAQSQRRQYRGDWVFTFIEGDRKEFDYGLDFTECGACKLFHDHGADELAPYFCLPDFVFSKAFNRGLVRSMTLAEGYDRCDFRYKRGRETFLAPLRNGWPPQFTKHV
jgi:hypothetical protein